MNPLLYAQVREDPEVDLKALQISSRDRVLAVTSGGCTALTLLARGPESLVCLDVNPAQNALFELKWAAVRSLTLSECRQFLGVLPSRDRWKMYSSFVGILSESSRRFWNSRRRMIEAGPLYAGSTEAMLRFFAFILRRCVHAPGKVLQLFEQQGPSAQKTFYRKIWNTVKWRGLLHVAFHPFVFRAAYPKGFLRRVREDSLTREWIRKIERAFEEIPIQSNYFLSQFLSGRYLPGEEGMPVYLRAEPFERIRRFSGPVTIVTQDLIDCFRRCPEGSFSKMTLSNALEWLPDAKIAGAHKALSNALAPAGRAVVRHLLGITVLDSSAGLKELMSLSDELTLEERAFLYCRVSVYEKNNTGRSS